MGNENSKQRFLRHPGARRGLLLIGLLILPLALTAQTPQAVSADRFALVIGNGDYTAVTKLKNPVNDATDMAAAMKKLGFQVDLLTDASLGQMEDAVVRLGNWLGQSPSSYGFFFYAGHGVQSNGINYLIPADADIRSEAFLKSKALEAQAILDTMQAANNSLNIVVLDACRDNPFGWARGSSRGLNVVSHQPPGSIIAYATSAGSVAQDGTGRNGLFTSQLLKNLQTPGLEIKDVFNRTGSDVMQASNNQQVPAVYNQFFKTAYLAQAALPPGETDGGSLLTRFSGGATAVIDATRFNELYTIDDYLAVPRGTGVRIRVFVDNRPREEYWRVAQDMKRGEKSDFSWPVLHGLYVLYAVDRTSNMIEVEANGNSVMAYGFFGDQAGALWLPVRQFAGRDDGIEIEWGGDRSTVATTSLKTFKSSNGTVFSDCMRFDVSRRPSGNPVGSYVSGIVVLAKGYGVVYAEIAADMSRISKSVIIEATGIKQFPPRQLELKLVPAQDISLADMCVTFSSFSFVRYLVPNAQGRISYRFYGDGLNVYAGKKHISEDVIDMNSNVATLLVIGPDTATNNLVLKCQR